MNCGYAAFTHTVLKTRVFHLSVGPFAIIISDFSEFQPILNLHHASTCCLIAPTLLAVLIEKSALVLPCVVLKDVYFYNGNLYGRASY